MSLTISRSTLSAKGRKGRRTSFDSCIQRMFGYRCDQSLRQPNGRPVAAFLPRLCISSVTKERPEHETCSGLSCAINNDTFSTLRFFYVVVIAKHDAEGSAPLRQPCVPHKLERDPFIVVSFPLSLCPRPCNLPCSVHFFFSPCFLSLSFCTLFFELTTWE